MLPFVPKTTCDSDTLLMRAFSRLDRRAFGFAVGVWFGLGVFGATILLLIKGGTPIGPTLGLLGQYFIGYTVTWSGCLVGLVYGFASGFCLGWFTAFLRNLFVWLYLENVRFKSSMSSVSDFVHKE